MSLNINEIFYSIQGETTTAGFPSVFIRLSGCNLKCTFCDTPDARENGREVSVDSVINELKKYKYIHHVTITGGEPLLQDDTVELAKRIIEAGHSVQIETNGSIDISKLPAGIRKIIDVKTPSSGEGNSFIIENLNFLSECDEVKFVISHFDDYSFSKKFVEKHLAAAEAVINFSPAQKGISYNELAELIIKDGLKVRLNIQLHKVIDFK